MVREVGVLVGVGVGLSFHPWEAQRVEWGEDYQRRVAVVVVVVPTTPTTAVPAQRMVAKEEAGEKIGGSEVVVARVVVVEVEVRMGQATAISTPLPLPCILWEQYQVALSPPLLPPPPPPPPLLAHPPLNEAVAAADVGVGVGA